MLCIISPSWEKILVRKGNHWGFEFLPRFIRKSWIISNLSSGFEVHFFWPSWCSLYSVGLVLDSPWDNFLILTASVCPLLSNLVMVMMLLRILSLEFYWFNFSTHYNYWDIGVKLGAPALCPRGEASFCPEHHILNLITCRCSSILFDCWLNFILYLLLFLFISLAVREKASCSNYILPF